MNRHERRKQAKKASPRCTSCGRRKQPQAKSIRDGKARCMVCHDLHMKASSEDLDPGNDVAARLQKAIQTAIGEVAGRDPRHAPLIFSALGVLAATYAVQCEMLDRAAAGADDEPARHEIDLWEETFAARSREFHRLVCQALQLRGQGPRPQAAGTVGHLRDQLEGLPASGRVFVGRRSPGEHAWAPVGTIRLGSHKLRPGGDGLFDDVEEGKVSPVFGADIAICAAEDTR